MCKRASDNPTRGRTQKRTSEPMLGNARSRGLWELTAPPAPDIAGLNGSIKVDTAIVGGGYTGLSAALHLAEAGANVALLESVDTSRREILGDAGKVTTIRNALRNVFNGLWWKNQRKQRLRKVALFRSAHDGLERELSYSNT